MKKHGMIDIETLSTSPTAAVIAIGAVAWLEGRVEQHESFEILIDPLSAVGTRDTRTLQWWDEQDKSVRDRMFSGEVLTSEALVQLRNWYLRQGIEEVWANAPTFDLIILEAAFRATGVEVPWRFRDTRCMRTLTRLAKRKGIDYQAAYDNRTAHDALSDALAQARAVDLILSKF